MTKESGLLSNPRVQLIVLLLFACFFQFAGISGVQLIDWDENIYGEASRQMMIRGDYLNVYINNQLFSEKPPFFFWEQVISYKLFGINEFAARFPSGVAGLLMILLFYHVGSRIGSRRLGLTWSLVYMTSFLPSVFSRAAVIDHTFNLFIAGGAYFLYLFDRELERYLFSSESSEIASKKYYFTYLILGSISMGVACLTKGPLGGVIPLVAFGGYKIFYRSPRIRLSHFFFCGVLSLSIALSWYLVNWINTGESFLEGFIRFQILLFSQSLEGHQGPVYYHFVVVLAGLLPWTPFLFAFSPRKVMASDGHYKYLIAFGGAWIAFVLILFSMVSTKLPHYSASVYIPLSMFVAFILNYADKEKIKFRNWVLISFGLLGISLGCLNLFLPQMLNQYAEAQLISFRTFPSFGVWLTGTGIAVLFVISVIALGLKKFGKGIILAALAMTLFTQGLWRFHLPVFVDIHQKPLLRLVNEANSRQSRLVFYRMVSFAAFFYGRKPIDILHNYKFEGDPSILNTRADDPIHIITSTENKKRLIREHPLAEFVKDSGRFSLFVIKARSVEP